MVVHYDPWWNLAAQNQATDRAHRIGQQKNVTVYKLITKDSIEEKVLELEGDKTGAGRPDHRTGNGAGGSHDQGRYAEASGDPDVNRGKPP